MQNLKNVQKKELNATQISLEFFDRLKEAEIIRESGMMVHRLDEIVEGFTVSDRLREMLLMKDSEYYSTYPKGDRNELLFHIFKHLCLGGSMCQHEDSIEPYLDTVKLLYKDLVSVAKNKGSNKIEVVSWAYQILDLDAQVRLFPRTSPSNFCYVIVDPIKRHITYWYFACLPYW